MVFGPNGSGKTTSLIVPNVLDWTGPVVMTTAKPQDLEPICTARAAHGPLWVIAPGGAPGHECTGWSPIAAASDDDAADRVAEWLVESSGMTGDPRSRPWNAQARKYLKGLLLAANLSGTSLQGWCDWLYAGERARDQIEDILRTHGRHAVAQEYASTFQIHDEGKGSVLFTAMGLADTYSRPGVVAAVASGGLDVDRLLAESGTLCIVTPSGEGDRFAPYFTALVTAVIHAAETRAAAQGGALTPRLLLALDEAGNVFRYPRLPHLLTTSRGNGIQLLLVYHDLAQVEHLYGGREVARTVLSNAKMRLLLPGVGDLDTLRYWSDLLGRTRTQTHGETSGADGHRSRSRNEHVDDLAPLHVLQQLPDGQAVLVYQNLPPTRVKLLPWYRNRRYQGPLVSSVASGRGVVSSGEDNALQRQLLRQAETIAQLRRAVEALEGETTDGLADLVMRVEELEDASAQPAAGTVSSWCWRYAGASATESLWKELGDWVDWIRHRYPLARRIPDCWAEHPELVEELTALWLAWQAAYVERDAPLTAAAEWHDRWLPGVLHRLEHGPFASSPTIRRPRWSKEWACQPA